LKVEGNLRQPAPTLNLQPSTLNAPDNEELYLDRSFDPASVFHRRAPLEVEIGSGKARFLIEAARANPAHDFLGLERSLAYFRICRDRIAKAQVPNARVLRADGRLFLEALEPGTVRVFHIYFPDPWPKKKQRKRRFLDAVSLEILAARLEPEGLLRIQTDHAHYGRTLAPLIETVPVFEKLDWEACPVPPPTHYEIKYRAEGRFIWRFLLRKRAAL
jgi:tRNA (guanine-N7-)-methyltransferase